MTHREAGDDQPLGVPTTCAACGHVFSAPTLSFTVDGQGDDGGLSFALPVGIVECPQCGTPAA